MSKYILVSYARTEPGVLEPTYGNEAYEGNIADWWLELQDFPETYYILSWQEITEEEFKKLDGIIG